MWTGGGKGAENWQKCAEILLWMTPDRIIEQFFHFEVLVHMVLSRTEENPRGPKGQLLSRN